MIEYPALLRAAGLTVVEVDGWQSRGRPGSFDPVGLLGHHTASARGSNPRGDRNVNLIRDGRPDLAGPLANFFHARDPIWYVVAAGRANHAGQGAKVVLDEIREGRAKGPDAAKRGLVDEVVGNGLLLGLEVDNDGVGEPYGAEQLDSIMVGLAAICRAHDWTAGNLALHREWTRRKIDWSYTGDFRATVTALLDGSEPDMTPEEHEMLRKLGVTLGALDNNAKARHAETQKRLDALEAKIGQGGGATPGTFADELAKRLGS